MLQYYMVTILHSYKQQLYTLDHYMLQLLQCQAKYFGVRNGGFTLTMTVD